MVRDSYSSLETLAKNQVLKKRRKEDGKKDQPKLDFHFLSGDFYTTAKAMEMKNMSK